MPLGGGGTVGMFPKNTNKKYGYWESDVQDPSKKIFTVAEGNKGTGVPYTGESEYGYVTDGRLGGGSTKPNWVDGTSSQGLATQGRRAPIVPLPGAVLLQPSEDEASADTKRPLGANGGSSRPVVDRTTGQVRREPDDEELRRGAILLR